MRTKRVRRKTGTSVVRVDAAVAALAYGIAWFERTSVDDVMTPILKKPLQKRFDAIPEADRQKWIDENPILQQDPQPTA